MKTPLQNVAPMSERKFFSFSSQKLDLFSPLLIQILQFNSFSTLTMKNY